MLKAAPRCRLAVFASSFLRPRTFKLSLVTLGLIRKLKETFGSDADVNFREQGYLLLASENGKAILRGNNEIQRAAGMDIHLMTPPALAERFPWLNVDGVASGSFGKSGEGWMDPVSLMTLFRRAAVERGAKVLKDTVVGIDRNGGRIESVTLVSGTTIKCGAVVNAAGHWAGGIAKLAGTSLPVEPRKRYVFVMDCRDATPELHAAPLTVDPSGVWFRPEGRSFITGVSPEEHNEPTPGDLSEINHSEFEEIVWPTIAARVPQFEAVKVTSAWAGHYDYNTLDQNAIIGPHPEVSNFYFANGFSGHGLQQSGGAGLAISELIVHGSLSHQ